MAASVAFGYGMFHLMLGPGSFSLWGICLGHVAIDHPTANDRMKARG